MLALRGKASSIFQLRRCFPSRLLCKPRFQLCSFSTDQSPKNLSKIPEKNPEIAVTPTPNQLAKRAPTVEEEIDYTKKKDLWRMWFLLMGVMIGKVVYDAYCNTLQHASYDDENVVERLWNELGEDTLHEGGRSRLMKQRYGKNITVDKEGMKILKKKQKRVWNTSEWVEKAAFLFLRYRWRIWEDIGTVEIVIPVQGQIRSGEIHVKAYTRDRHWILARSWFEDDEMIIEVKRRIDLKFILNPDAEFLREVERSGKKGDD